MTSAFEVLDKDIAGRLGRLVVDSKVVHTPALLPVVNPHLLLITPAEMHTMGVEALITNAYIFYHSDRFREDAEQNGLHRVLGFNGVIMTDSGAFQQSVYGSVDITNQITVEFQKMIGSDILVPMDIPTPPGADRATAVADLATTQTHLAEARELAGERTCAGPVQGGIYPDLRRKAAEQVQTLGFTICPIGAVVPLMEQYRFRDLVRVVLSAKAGLSPSSAVHLFGAGHPSMFALAVAMGCDLFDSAAYALFAKDRRYLTGHGSYRLDELAELPCPCEVCRKHTATELRESPVVERLLALHNLSVTLAEIARIRQAIRDGTLWELVDERCHGHPRLLDGYHELIRHTGDLQATDRAAKRRFFYRSWESCHRTEVLQYHHRIQSLSLPPKVVILIGQREGECQDETLLFRPPFGPYPSELSETFPIGQSVIPEWDEDMVRAGCEGIRSVISSHTGTVFSIECSDRWYEVVRSVLPDVVVRRAVR